MTILEMIAEWKRGCTCGGPRAVPTPTASPADCVACTEGLIRAIERRSGWSWWFRNRCKHCGKRMWFDYGEYCSRECRENSDGGRIRS